jgi:hypothetical protein
VNDIRTLFKKGGVYGIYEIQTMFDIAIDLKRYDLIASLLDQTKYKFNPNPEIENHIKEKFKIHVSQTVKPDMTKTIKPGEDKELSELSNEYFLPIFQSLAALKGVAQNLSAKADEYRLKDPKKSQLYENVRISILALHIQTQVELERFTSGAINFSEFQSNLKAAIQGTQKALDIPIGKSDKVKKFFKSASDFDEILKKLDGSIKRLSTVKEAFEAERDEQAGLST